MAKEFKIHDLVISSNIGVGEIIGFEKLESTKEEFLVIQSEEKQIKTLIPLREAHQIRKLATSKQIKDSLLKLKIKPKRLDFECKKERMTYFRERSNHQDINTVVNTIVELTSLADRGVVENRILSGLKQTLAQEIELVMKINSKEADKMIDDLLKE